MLGETGSAPARPHLTIRPSSGWVPLDLRETWQFRDLLFVLAGRDLKVRYKQTVLGVAWVILQPLIAAGIFAFVFGGIARFEAPGGVPYFLFSFVGLLGWNVFSTTVTKASNSMLGNTQLVSKVYFPRLILPLSTTFATLIDFGVASMMLGAMLVLFWHVPVTTILFAPVCVLLFLMLALGIGFFAASLTVYYRDIPYVLPIALQFLLYASPVAYAAREVPEAYQTIYHLNPLAGLLEAFRWSVLGVGDVPWGYFAYSAGVAVIVFVAGAFAFKRMEREFADVI